MGARPLTENTTNYGTVQSAFTTTKNSNYQNLNLFSSTTPLERQILPSSINALTTIAGQNLNLPANTLGTQKVEEFQLNQPPSRSNLTVENDRKDRHKTPLQ